MITDITKRTGFSAYCEAYIEPRRIELAKILGTYKKIEVKDPISFGEQFSLYADWISTGNLESFARLQESKGDHAGAKYIREVLGGEL